ncbi:MAG: urate hydroxylase PuuD [Gammaproteobacteria bacterium]
MEAYVVDWLSLLGRWVHFITGIAWIGASFYFVWLDNHLLPVKDSQDADKGVGGEVWSVHGGGFYHAQKYRVAPTVLPETLHWFKWEAYATWLSGIFLLALVYWYGAEVYLIDSTVADLSKPLAIGISVVTLVAGWTIYDLLCKSALGNHETALGLVIFVLAVFAAWGLCQLFSGRGAFIHYGAMLGTIMVANVFFVIIPGQRELVNATREGRTPDPGHGLRGKQRSVHNTYFTLPVLFVMISNHYAMTYGHAFNWLILVAISLAGALIRVYFVARHKGSASPVPIGAAALLLLAVSLAIAPKLTDTAPARAGTAKIFAQVQTIVEARCAGCHAVTPTQPGFTAPPNGVVFDTSAQIVAQAVQIHQQTVVTQAMPIANLTRITDDERALLDQWFKGGARAE